VLGGIRSLYCGLTQPLALKKLFGSEARLNSTHGLKGAFGGRVSVRRHCGQCTLAARND
jgi:hypothetical protein